MTHRLSKLPQQFLMALALVSCSLGQVPKDELKVNLVPLGYKPGQIGIETKNNIAFDARRERLAVGFKVRADGKLLNRETGYRFIVVILDSVNGRSLAQHSFQIRHDSRPELFWTNGSRLIVKIDQDLKLLDDSFAILANRTVEGDALLSLDRSTLLLHTHVDGFMAIDVLASNTLVVRRRCKYSTSLIPTSVAPDEILFADKQRGVALAQTCGDPRRLPEQKIYPDNLAFLSADEIAIGDSQKLILINRAGERVLEKNNPAKSSFDWPIRASMNGQRFALAVNKYSGGFLDTTPRRADLSIGIYDTGRRKLLVTIKVTPIPKAPFDYTLSSKGDLLAFLADGVVTVVRLSSSN